MGYEFDDNGKYVGWSDLFDYSGIEELKASEYLPIPDGVKYIKSVNGFDISEQILNITSTTNKAKQLHIYAKLLTQLQDLKVYESSEGEYTNVIWNETIPEELAQTVLNNLNLHSQTELSPQKIEKCLKNSVSSSITNIIQHLRNMDQAYSPVEMEAIRKGSRMSPKGNKAARMTLLNPLTKFIMQEQNMVGKDAIGINANGEKAFFNLSLYWNEGIRSNNEEWIRNLQFSLQFNRIQGRAKGELKPTIKSTLANVNFENVEEMRLRFAEINPIDNELRNKYGITDYDIEQKTDNWKKYKDELIDIIRSQLDSDVYADDLISLLLSCATDNAKELILSKINAGTNLARCYLHLIMMGFEINDIVSFMVSPVVSIIDNLSNANMFDEYLFKNNVIDIINTLNGDFKISKFLKGSIQNGKNFIFANTHALNNLTKLKIELSKLGFAKEYNSLDKLIKDYYIARINNKILLPLSHFLSTSTKDRFYNNFIAFSDYVDNVISKVIDSKMDVNEFFADLNEFSKVYELASETSTLSSVLLGLNQGLPSSKVDILNKIFKILKAFSDRELVFGITDKIFKEDKTLEKIITELFSNNPNLTPEYILEVLTKARDLNIINNFDFIKWLNNPEYKQVSNDYYNVIKGTWNIFDVVNRLPHYNAILKAFLSVVTIDQTLIKKSHLLNLISKDVFKNNNYYIEESNITSLLDYVDDLLIIRWLDKQLFRFPIFEGDKLFKFNWEKEIFKGKLSSIIIDNESNRGTFKNLIESRLIQHLKEGYYYDIDENGNKVEKEVDKNNKFLQNLVFDITNQDQTYLRLDLDMQNTSSTTSNESRYQECLSDFIKLKNNYLLGRPITDWIMIYNLIINKNKFGSDRMTTLFGEFLKMTKEDSIIKSILQETGNLDYSELDIKSIEDLKEWGYDRDDALFKIAPIISKALEASANSEMVKEIKDGRMIVKRKKYNDYGKSEEIIPNTTSNILDENEQNIDLNSRLQNYMNHGTIKTPFANKKSSVVTNLMSEDLKLVTNALLQYLKLGIIEIYTENC